MALLGDDGRGYELARKLEACGVWRAWLGDTCYSSFIHSLSSPSTWESFMRVDDSKSKTQIHLQLRARALLFDKAAVALFLPSNWNSISPSVAVSKLNPNYLQLHGGDVYFTLESSAQDGFQQRESGAASNTAPSKSKSSFNAGSRYGESEFDNLPQRFRNEELPETWYDQFFEKYRVSRPYKLSFGNRELDKRTPEEMSAYLRHLEKHKRRRVPYQEEYTGGLGNSVLENASNLHSNSVLDVSNPADGDIFLPEAMFTFNCVPEAAVPSIRRENIDQKVEYNGVLDNLPHVMTRSPVMIERLGIRPEYLGMEHGGSLHRGKNGSGGNKDFLGEDQASHTSQKVIVQMLRDGGFEGATEVPLEVFSELLGSHICKLGRKLKILADGYRRQCSAIELIKMFLQAAEIGNFAVLTDLVKNDKNTVQQTQQQVHGMQSQVQSPNDRNTVQQTQQQLHGMQSQVQSPNDRNTVQQTQQQVQGTQSQLLSPNDRNSVQQAQQQVHGMQSQLQSPNDRNTVQQTQQQVHGMQSQLQSPNDRNAVQQTQQQVHGMQSQVQSPNDRNTVQQTQQQVHGLQSQLQSPTQSPLRLSQQIPRQIPQQMSQSQSLIFQQQMQQQHLMRRRQPSTPRAGMDMDKDRMIAVKMESQSELPIDANALNAVSAKQSQVQIRQQQLNAMSNLQAQSSNQFRQLTSVQIPQMQTPSVGAIARAPPVKVEGFQELMGGDASLKHDAEENKLTSPASK